MEQIPTTQERSRKEETPLAILLLSVLVATRAFRHHVTTHVKLRSTLRCRTWKLHSHLHLRHTLSWTLRSHCLSWSIGERIPIHFLTTLLISDYQRAITLSLGC